MLRFARNDDSTYSRFFAPLSSRLDALFAGGVPGRLAVIKVQKNVVPAPFADKRTIDTEQNLFPGAQDSPTIGTGIGSLGLGFYSSIITTHAVLLLPGLKITEV